MAVLHRALCTWFICLIFLILLVLQLDERTRWSWFIVFIPMWIYDSILILYLLFNMITHCKNGHDGSLRTMKRKIWCFVCIVLKLTAQIMLCLKLENNDRSIYIPLYYVMIPIWIILAISTVDIFFTLISNRSA
uniref:Transmembrane protein 60 n=1 Tax=Lepeophtheirus salmonis TaxID=72036 RepID=D3PJD9_LEPSM|nr:Transmembrane protein 60 [Lepeophtheirus salmonis]